MEPRMRKTKSLSDWMTSARSGMDPDSCSQAPPTQSKGRGSRKRKAPSCSKRRGAEVVVEIPDADRSIPWVSKYQPKTLMDLAVNKKKVSEVRDWLEFALSGRVRAGHQPMLLLTGPPGCGKTACLHVLSKEMGFSILEWVNPDLEGGRLAVTDPWPGNLVVYPESQYKQFTSFILRANRYPTLSLMGNQAGTTRDKVVLVEEFPNAFLRDPDSFYRAMESIRCSLRHPLVFIASESHRGGSSASTIFRKDRLSRLDVYNISFNPVAQTSMIKTLQQIAKAEKLLFDRNGCSWGTSFEVPPREVLEVLASSSSGDVRNAINALQVLCVKDDSGSDLGGGHVPEPSVPKRSKVSQRGSKSSGRKAGKRDPPGSSKSSGQDGGMAGIGGRDNSLFLFRALGKILYTKRDEERGVAHTLPPHLKEHERSPLLVCPEEVVETCHLSADMFSLYLHENFLEFCEEMDDISLVLGCVSNSDILASLWSDHKDVKRSLEQCSVSVACRGVMLFNKSTPAGKWRPLHKPGWLTIHRQMKENKATCRSLFQSPAMSPDAHLWTPTDLLTELLPYQALVNSRLHNPDQVAFLQSVVNFTTFLPRHMGYNLGEREAETDQSSLSDSLEASARVGPSQESQSSDHMTKSSDHVTASRHSAAAGIELHMTNDDDIIEDFDDDSTW